MQTDAPRLLRRRLLMLWSAVWLAGIGVLLAVALFEGISRRQGAVDQELQLRAMGVYGLTWFTPAGTLNRDLFDREPLLNDPRYGVWIFDARSEVWVLNTLGDDALDTTDLEAAISPITSGAADEASTEHAGYRLFAAPLFDDHSDEVRGVVLVGTAASWGAADQRQFSLALLLTAAGLGLLGLILGRRLTRYSVEPFADAVQERERFLAAAAHELRTPVATLAAICESSLAGDEPERTALERIQAVVGRTQGSVENLLLFARLTKGDGGLQLRATPVRLDLLADKVAAEFEGIDVHRDSVTLRLDSELCEVAIRNLLVNAKQHAGERSVELWVHNNRVEVRDGGPGYPAGLIGQEIRPFAPHGTSGGSGLGLSIVDHIARLHGATLRLRNTDSGAVAMLEFGAMAPDADAPRTTQK